MSHHSADFLEALSWHQQRRIPVAMFFQEILRVLPEVCLLLALLTHFIDAEHKVISTLRALRQPLSIPLSLASLNLVTKTTTSFNSSLLNIRDDTNSIADSLAAVRQLYEITKIPNRVKVQVLNEKSPKDPSETSIEHNQDPDDPLLGIPFPEDQQSLELGISVEFCHVSFKYPGSDSYALKNVSFKIERGQLCVIVGNNGSGKSTILKLAARLYDPLEGEIRFNGQDIKTLRFSDLRNAIAVLFQDYTLFPLNVSFLFLFALFFPLNSSCRFETTSHSVIRLTLLTSLEFKRLLS